MTTETTPLDVDALRKSFQDAATADPDFFATFYERLHEEHAELWDQDRIPHFPPWGSKGMRAQIDSLGMAIAETLDHLTDPQYLALLYHQLGKQHRDYGALGQTSVDAVAEALLWTFRETLEDGWTEHLETQWTLAYTTLIGLMRAGAAEG